MFIPANPSVFPCENCTHRGICKYEDDVMSFVRCAKLPEQECLSIKYDCKYKGYMNTSLFNGYRDYELTMASNTDTCSTTSRPYTIDTSSECVNKI